MSETNPVIITNSDKTVREFSVSPESALSPMLFCETGLYLIESGSGNFFCDEVSHKVQKGDICVCPIFSFTRLEADNEMKVTSLFISSDICDTIGITDLNCFEPVISNDKELALLFAQAKDEGTFREVFSELSLMLIKNQMLVLLYRSHRIRSFFDVHTTTLQTCILVRNAVKIMYAHLSEALSTKDIARQLYISTPYLDRCFSVVAGKSPVKYINDIRTNYAKLLLSCGFSVNDVFPKLGFGNDAYFVRVFKKRYGMSPRKFAVSQSKKQPS